jgi:hypothetical protein
LRRHRVNLLMRCILNSFDDDVFANYRVDRLAAHGRAHQVKIEIVVRRQRAPTRTGLISIFAGMCKDRRPRP